VVSGSAEAIAQVEKIVRLVDIPAPRYRIRARFLSPGGVLPELEDAAAHRGELEVGVLSRNEAEELARSARTTFVDETLVVGSNRAGRIFWEEGPGFPAGSAAIVPRGNGDGSVTVMISVQSEARKPEDPATETALPSIIRRVYDDVHVVVKLEAGRAVLLLEVEAVPEGRDAPRARPPQRVLTTETIRLAHRSSSDVVRLFFEPSQNIRDPAPRISLIPAGIEGVLDRSDQNALWVQGTESAVLRFRTTTRLVDVAPEPLDDGRTRLRLAPSRPPTPLLRSWLEALPGKGRVEVVGGEILLEGEANWLRDALRLLIAAELH
jgi:hypothetical protein